jgi:hypothetical protein
MVWGDTCFYFWNLYQEIGRGLEPENTKGCGVRVWFLLPLLPREREMMITSII